MTLTPEVASLKQLCSLTMPTAAGVGPVISLVLRFLSKRSDIVALFFSQTLDAGLQQDLDRGRRCCTRQSSVLKLPWKCHRNGFVWATARDRAAMHMLDRSPRLGRSSASRMSSTPRRGMQKRGAASHLRSTCYIDRHRAVTAVVDRYRSTSSRPSHSTVRWRKKEGSFFSQLSSSWT